MCFVCWCLLVGNVVVCFWNGLFGLLLVWCLLWVCICCWCWFVICWFLFGVWVVCYGGCVWWWFVMDMWCFLYLFNSMLESNVCWWCRWFLFFYLFVVLLLLWWIVWWWWCNLWLCRYVIVLEIVWCLNFVVWCLLYDWMCWMLKLMMCDVSRL